MTNSQAQDHNQHADHQQLLKQLAWAMEMGASEQEFSLIFAHCNYTQWRDQLIKQLAEVCSVEILPIGLTPEVTQLYRTIYSKIQSQLGQQPRQGIMVYGFEVVRDLEQLLRLANRVREEFRKQFHVPVLFWVDDRVYSQFLRSARDLASWGTGSTLDFQISTANVIEFIQQVTDLGFAQVLAAGGLHHGQNLSNQQLADLRWAWKDLQHQQVELALDLEASVEFILGRGIPDDLNQSQEHYQRSIELWEDLLRVYLSPDPEHLIRYGCVLFHMGQCYHTYADLDRNQDTQHCLRAKDYFMRSHDCFEQAKRPDLVAKFINSLGEILQRLGLWHQLSQLAKKALTLHQQYPNPVWLAHDYGILAAEVAISCSQWDFVKNLATTALEILTDVKHSVQLPGDLTREQLDWAWGLHQGWYRLSLARAYNHLAQPHQGIKHLELAKEQTLPNFNPYLYIRILTELRQLYFDQGEYQKAFSVKAYQQSIEYQFRFRAFVGVAQLSLNQGIRNTQVADPIAASGREQAINDLAERIGRKDHKLTVICGSSGVGKSFLLQSGLIPRLQQEIISARDVEPVLLRVYNRWQDRLAQKIIGTDQGRDGKKILDKIIHQLQHNSNSNRLTVLIFDQFEEFFVESPQPQQRRVFYQFLKDCLNLEAVNVILALREDYIYYLLECNERLISLDVVNNDILSKDVLYYLSNFTQPQAKGVIERLTEQAKFSLEPELIEQLVKDLAAETGEVRPIELQVVGAQLETEVIVTLERYRQRGDKEKLVERYLEAVVTDCGPEYQETTWKLLFILTDDKQLRPIRSETELASVLNLVPEQISLILEILVGSGLVFEIPLGTEDLYQLVHDYLVDPIRNKIEKKKRILEQNKQELEKLEQAGDTHLKKFKDSPFDALLAAMETGKTLKAMVTKNTPLKDYPGASPLLALQQILDYIQEPRLVKHQGKVKQVAFMRDGQHLASAGGDGIVRLWDLNTGQVQQELKAHWAWVKQLQFSRDGQHLAIAAGNGIVRLYDLNTGGVQQKFEGHGALVMQLQFSWDGQHLAIAAGNGIVRLCDLNTGQVQELKGHRGWVSQMALSWDGQLLASAGFDGIMRVWNIKTRQVQELKGHQGRVYQVEFSWDSQLLASAGVNGIVRLWDVNTGQVQAFTDHHRKVDQVKFSPDGQLLASAGGDRTVRLWDLAGRQIAQFDGTQMVFNPDGTQVATIDGDTIKLWRVDTLDGLLARGCAYLRSYLKHSYVNPELKAFCDRLLKGEGC
ncbi:MAG: AAA family ATPase [Moorea sp. SIO4A3]|nr:AAA family ATPase [Moorena sp. SIO4A3]